MWLLLQVLFYVVFLFVCLFAHFVLFQLGH